MCVDGQIQVDYTICGQGNFLIWKEKVADSKICGYMCTWPERCFNNNRSRTTGPSLFSLNQL